MSDYVDASLEEQRKANQEKMDSEFNLPSLEDMLSEVQSRTEAFSFDRLDKDMSEAAEKDEDFKNF